MGRLNHTVSDTVASFYNGEIGNINNLKCYFEPVQAGSGTPSPDNVRPITGWTGLDVIHGGKNFLTDTVVYNSTPSKNMWEYTLQNNSITYHKKVDQIAFALIKAIDVITPDMVGLKFVYSASTINVNDAIVSCGLDGNNRTTVNNGVITQSDVGKCLTVRFYTPGGTGSATVTNMQLRLSTSSESYAYYTRSTIPVSWAFSGTVYGGYVDLISGDVVAEWGSVIYDGSEDENWSVENINNFYIMTPSNFVRETNDTTLLCDHANSANHVSYNGLCRITSTGNFNIRIGTLINVSTVTDFKTWLSSNNVQIVSRLATPTTVTTLTPTQLSTLRGQNNIWSTANGNVEVTYDLYESGAMAAGRKMIMANQPYIKTTTPANIATFNSDMVAPLKQVKINFSPKQEGSGDPSPTNVRPISGWTGIETYTRGKNLIPSGLTTVGKYKPESGIIKTSSAYRTFYFPVPKGNIYYQAGTRGVSYACFVDEFVLGTPVYLQVTMSSRNSYNFDNSDGHKYMVIFGGNNDDFDTAVDYYTLRITTGGYTDYEAPKVGRDISIDWSSAGTVYGGYVDLVTGDVVATHELFTVSTIRDVSDSTGYAMIRVGDNGYVDASATSYCNMSKFTTELASNMPYGCFKMGNSNAYNCAQIYMKISADLNGSTTTETYFNYKNYVESLYNNGTPIQVCFGLATPITVATLTPAQINTLKGVNNIWSNANGNITVQYWTH